MKPKIGITEKNLNAVNKLLNNILADGNVFYLKLRKYHWNLQGDNFMELHELFESQYDDIALAIDEIAERITTLGGVAMGTMEEFLKTTQLKENPGKIPTNQQMIKDLVADHETIVRTLRKAIEDCEEKYKDVGTADFLTELIQRHEKMAWKLRKYIR